MATGCFQPVLILKGWETLPKINVDILFTSSYLHFQTALVLLFSLMQARYKDTFEG